MPNGSEVLRSIEEDLDTSAEMVGTFSAWDDSPQVEKLLNAAAAMVSREARRREGKDS